MNNSDLRDVTSPVSRLRVVPSCVRSVAAALIAAAFLLVLVVPAALGRSGSISWAEPTPASLSRFTVKAGSPLSFRLAASTSVAGAAVRIVPVAGLPAGATFSSSGGSAARASFRWVPRVAGVYTLRFVASTGRVSTPRLTYVVRVSERVEYPRTSVLSNERVAQWGVVLRPAVVRLQPRLSARAVTTLETMTSDDTQNLVLVLQALEVSARETWYRVRLPVLPNNTTGWVQRSALGRLYTVHTHLYVDRARLTATLKRDGVTVFQTRVGVGRSYWPTPRGEFYVRSKLTNFDSPVYGPVAFGTSARSAVLTDWPGGGFVGIHGTNEPNILPGRVSHGCIRLRNEAILQLAALMPVGTPLTIR